MSFPEARAGWRERKGTPAPQQQMAQRRHTGKDPEIASIGISLQDAQALMQISIAEQVQVIEQVV